MSGLQAFLARHGLLAVFAGAAVEGDLTMLLAGVLAHAGFFALWAAILTGVVAGLLVDVALFGAGRAGARRVRETGFYRRVGPLAERLAARLGPWQIVLARFVWGTKNATMLFWGLRGFPLWRFMAYDLLGTALWAAGFASAGYLVSRSAMRLLGDLHRLEMALGLALVAGVGTLLWFRRRAERAAAENATQPHGGGAQARAPVTPDETLPP